MRSSRRSDRCRAVGDEDVDAAVVVVVEQRDAVAGRFEDVFLAGVAARHVRRGEAGAFGDVLEVDGDGRQIGVDARDRPRRAASGWPCPETRRRRPTSRAGR